MKNAVIFFSLFFFFCFLGYLYSDYRKAMIRKNIAIGTAFIYKTDVNTRYGHYRIWYTINYKNELDSTFSIRDDISRFIFLSLSGKKIKVVFDSTNPKSFNHLLITKDDYVRFNLNESIR